MAPHQSWHVHQLLLVLVSYWSAVMSLPSPTTDGFNIYKDLMIRNKVDEPEVLPEEKGGHKMYFYRAPTFYLVPAISDHPLDMEQEFRKRSSNHYKNYMLSPSRGVDVEVEKPPVEGAVYHFPRVALKKDHGWDDDQWATEGRLAKKSPGSILTWAVYSKHLPDRDSSLLFSPFSENLRLPISDKSSAFVAKMGKRSISSQNQPGIVP